VFASEDAALLVVLLDPEVMACQDEPSAVSPARVGISGTITEPKKLRNEMPEYPDAARQNRVQGP
jgi:hypothetical protein